MSWLEKYYAVSELRGKRNGGQSERFGWAVIKHEHSTFEIVMVYRDQIEADRLCILLQSQKSKEVEDR